MSSKRGIAYGIESSEVLKTIEGLNYKRLNYEKAESMDIWSFDVEEYQRAQSSIVLLKIEILKCKYGENINFSSIYRLPQEGWQN